MILVPRHRKQGISSMYTEPVERVNRDLRGHHAHSNRLTRIEHHESSPNGLSILFLTLPSSCHAFVVTTSIPPCLSLLQTSQLPCLGSLLLLTLSWFHQTHGAIGEVPTPRLVWLEEREPTDLIVQRWLPWPIKAHIVAPNGVKLNVLVDGCAQTGRILPENAVSLLLSVLLGALSRTGNLVPEPILRLATC